MGLLFKSFASSSAGNFYVLDDGKEKLLIEAGIRMSKIMKALNFDLSNIVGCLLSHSHLDHAKSARELSERSIDIYSVKETFSSLGLEGRKFHHIEHLKQFSVGGYIILPFPLEHDVVNTGYLIYSRHAKQKILFLTDSYYCRYRFNKVDYYAVECNHSIEILKDKLSNKELNRCRYNRLLKSHFSLENIKKFLKANDLSSLKHIYLLHLSKQNSIPELFKNEVQKQTGIPVTICN